MTEPWSSVDEVAKHRGVAQDSIYRWIEAQDTEQKIGRLWKFKLSEVDAWVRAGGAEAFQYILTTTTQPPGKFLAAPWLRLQLAGVPAEERLLRCDL